MLRLEMIGLARIYSPTLGRFLQTDPIGYGDGLNWYNYVGSDPVNATDPSGQVREVPALPSGTCGTQWFDADGKYHQSTHACGGGGSGGGSFGGFVRSGGGGNGFGDGNLQGGGGGAPVDVTVNAVRKKPKNDDLGRPKYCFSLAYQAGKGLEDFSKFGDKVANAFIVLGFISGGTGLPLAFGFKSAAGLGQLAGTALQRFAGDPTATGRAINNGIGLLLPGGVIPRSLKSEGAEFVFGEAQSRFLALIEQKSRSE